MPLLQNISNKGTFLLLLLLNASQSLLSSGIWDSPFLTLPWYYLPSDSSFARERSSWDCAAGFWSPPPFPAPSQGLSPHRALRLCPHLVLLINDILHHVVFMFNLFLFFVHIFSSLLLQSNANSFLFLHSLAPNLPIPSFASLYTASSPDSSFALDQSDVGVQGRLQSFECAQSHGYGYGCPLHCDCACDLLKNHQSECNSTFVSKQVLGISWA